MVDYLKDLMKKVKEGSQDEKHEAEKIKEKLKEDARKEEKKQAKEEIPVKKTAFSEEKKPPEDKPVKDDALPEKEQDEAAKSEAEKKLEKAKKVLVSSYGDAKIYKVEGEALLYYFVPVPRPTGSERAIINTIKEAATRIISITPYRIRDPQERRNVYYQRVIDILRESPDLKVPERRWPFYADAVVREMVGFGLIDSLVKDDKLEEIMIIGPQKPVYVFHREYEMLISNVEFYSDKEVQDLINRIARLVGRRVDLNSPLLDARLPDGSRVNATIPPASVDGSTLTIRKFRADPYSVIDLINAGTFSYELAAFMWLCVEGMGVKPANILISGGTGSGKTTTLNVLASFIPSSERVITLEDTAELSLPLKHWIRMEGKPPSLEGTGEITLDVLTKNSLRMRPDRIIVGEVRHDEAFSLFTAMNTGHDGCLTGNNKIALVNGVREIGEFAEEQMSKSQCWNEGDWQVCSVKGERINSLDAEGKVCRSEIVQARKRPFNGRVYHIKLASGSEITCTGNHPFYTFNKGIKDSRADALCEGQRIATPRRLERDRFSSEAETEYWSGLLHGDGHITDSKRIRRKGEKEYLCQDAEVSLYTEEEETIPRFIDFIKNNLGGAKVRVVPPRPEKKCFEAHISGIGNSRQLQNMLMMPAGSRQKIKMSNRHFVLSLREFVAGFFDAEGHVDKNNNALVFTCANEEYIDFFRYALLTEGIASRKYESKSGNSRWFRLYIYGIDQVEKFSRVYPIKFKEKIRKLNELIAEGKKANTNVDVIECNSLVSGFVSEAKKLGYSISEVARRAGLSKGLVSFYLRNERMPSRDAAKKLAAAFESIGIDCRELRMLADSDIFWDKIVSIHSYEVNDYVYDLTTNEAAESGTMPHNFVAECMIVGNSMGTVHANSPEETVVRLTSPPMSVPQMMLSGLDFIIVEHRIHDKKKGTIRRITEIAEISGVLEGKARTQTIFEWNAPKDTIERTQIPISYLNELEKFTGTKKKQIEAEIDDRAKFLQKLSKSGIRAIKDVSSQCESYILSKRENNA